MIDWIEYLKSVCKVFARVLLTSTPTIAPVFALVHQGYLSGMLMTIAQRGVLIVIEAPTKVINLFLRELKQREAAYAAVAAKHQVGDVLETQTCNVRWHF